MCGVCCKEFKAWWRSFTTTECFLIILEIVLLVLLFLCLVFLVLHFITCGHAVVTTVLTYTTTPEPTEPPPTDASPPPLVPSKCTWKPSQTTEAPTHYYESDATKPMGMATRPSVTALTTPRPDLLQQVHATSGSGAERAHAAALVRAGRALCVLASVAPRWALGAAGCVAAARPRVALRVVGAAGDAALLGLRAHAAGLALLRVERAAALPARLPAPLDALLLALGDQLTLLQFDPEKQPNRKDNEVLAKGAALVGRSRCGAGKEALCAACYGTGAGGGAGGEAGGGAGGAGGGALLLRDGMLLGVSAAAPCPLASYLNVAPIADWIRETILYDTYE